MSMPNQAIITLLGAVAVATLSGYISAITLMPFMDVMEQMGLGDLLGILSTFGLTAGLAFGLLGGGFSLWRLRVSPLAAGAFLVASILGMAAATYLAMLSFDNAANDFKLSYLLGSLLGALFVAVPFALLGRFAHPARTIGLAVALPTVWAVGVAASLSNGDAALEVPGLAALYVGWQVIFLGVFAATPRKA